MKWIEKIIKIIIFTIFSSSTGYNILNRTRRTKEALNSTKELHSFWLVMTYPVKLTMDLCVSTLKIILIWILPTYIYYNLKFALINLMYEDIVIKRIGLKISLKRCYLFFEMCIKGRERKNSYGEKNPDKIFFVIRPYYYMKVNELATSVSHLMFHYYRNLEHLSYAIEKGYIPVVDWENYGPFAHSEDEPVYGTSNCWEYYFNQPSAYSLQEVYQSKNVILSIQNSREYGFIPKAKMLPPLKKYAQSLMEKCPKYAQYFSFNKRTELYISNWYKKLFPQNKKILGVAVRGVSYGAKKIANHPVQPTIEELEELIDIKIKEWNIDYIFVACEAEKIVQSIKNKFDGKVIVLPRLRYKKDSSEEYNPLYEKGNRYQSNLDYVTEMALLSKCDCLIAAMSSGVRTALIWNANRYEQIEIVEKGIW